jgi:hypothetical protein
VVFGMTKSRKAAPSPWQPPFKFETRATVLSELAIRIWGRFEQIGYRMKESTAAGVELRPDISVGIRFAEWLRKNHPGTAAKHKEYPHWTPAGEFPSRQYENAAWPLSSSNSLILSG